MTGNSVCGCNGGCASNSFEIFQGQYKVMNLRAAYQSTGLPLDLTNCTQISVALPNADGTFASLTLTASQVVLLSPPVLGQFNVLITTAISNLLNAGVKQNVDVTFTISGLVTIVRYWGILSVLEAN